jgi:RoxA-like, cytochrome c-like
MGMNADRVARRVFWTRLGLVAAAVVVLAGLFVARYRFRDEPVRYADDFEHFKYGSIGSEPGGSVLSPEGGFLPPYGIFKALPVICPEMLPGGYRAGYQSLGLIFEDDNRDLPVGISKRRRLGIDLVGVNCALCHVGTVLDGASGQPRVVPGMPAVRTDVHRLMKVMVDCILDPRFDSPADVVRKIGEAGVPVGPVDRLIVYPRMLPGLRAKIRKLKIEIGFLIHEVPSAGPGRLDTFNPLKGLELQWGLGPGDYDQLTGPVDFPHLWGLPARDGRGLHWDGNLDSVDETVRSAVLGVGVKPRTLDREGLDRVTRYIMQLQPPPYPYPIDRKLARTGAALFQTHCASCHEERIGRVTDIHQIGVDPHRLDAFSAKVAADLPPALREKYQAPLFTFTHFRKTHGYVNVPLDGLWARAPYLHNGSVPSLEALLERPEARPKFFVRGSDVLDPERVGFMALPSAEGSRFAPPVPACPRRGRHDWTPSAELRSLLRVPQRDLFLFDATCAGNGNRGHDFGTALAPDDKAALLEFLKTL